MAAPSPSSTRRPCVPAAPTFTWSRAPPARARDISPRFSRRSIVPVAEHRVEHVMGMPVSIEVLDDIAPAALDEAFAWLRRVDAMFSTYRSDSEISRIERGTLTAKTASAEVCEVLASCEAHRVASGGFFDIRAGGRLDPSGFVKGWAV